jgi:nucleotide-binding universal stress UspA family protein
MAGNPAPIKRIVVGVDGSDQSALALDWGIDLARALKAEVIAVFAVHIPPYAYAGYETVAPIGLDDRFTAELKHAFEDEWCAPLKSSGLKFQTLMETGRPAQVISDAADNLNADLIVVGRRGRGEVAELLLGSVSHELSHHSRRPVVLVSHR